MGGGSTINNSDTRIEALKLQSSAYGVVLPVVGGTTRIPGNLIYYNDFKSTPHTTSQGGGKGGGVKTQNTTYSYSASVIMSLGHGPIQDVKSIWVGKKRFDSAWTQPAAQSFTQSIALPSPGLVVTLAQLNVTGVNLITVSTVVYTPGGDADGHADYGVIGLADGVDYTVDIPHGKVTFLNSSTVRKIAAASSTGYYTDAAIAYTTMANPVYNTAAAQLGISIANGIAQQPAPSWMTTSHASEALGYAYQALAYAQDYQLGTGAQVENHTFEVVGYGAYSLGTDIPDCNPADFTRLVLTNGRWGARMPASALQSFLVWSNYCTAAGILLSPALTTQTKAADFVTLMARLTNSAPIWSVNKLKLVPYGDAPMGAYQPNLTPVYDLTDDHFIAAAGDPPVLMTRNSRSDRYNNVKIQFSNRDNYYNVEVAEVKDDADISVNGLRTMDDVPGDWICKPDIAQTVATLLMQRSLNVTATYEFKLPWSFCLLEPMDLVTLTDADLGLNKTTVRITKVSEDADGVLAITAESFTAGIATAATYSMQASGGYQLNYNAPPQSVAAPAFFEMPASKTLRGLGLYVGACAQAGDANWGGCNVWMSLDGTNYKQLGTVTGAVRLGHLSTGIAAGDTSLRVLLDGRGGQITSATAAAASQNQSLLWIDNAAGGEYVNFTTSTLNAANDYTLAINRGAYTCPATAHAANARVVRVDDALLSKNDLDVSMIGQTLHFKFTSFNIFGAGEEPLSAVADYTYTITGGQAKLPPMPPTLAAAAAESFGIRLSCTASPDPDVIRYEWRAGSTWATAAVIAPDGGTTPLWKPQTAGSYTVLVCAVDIFGNYSAPASASITVTAGTIGALTSTILGADVLLDWSGAAGSFAIQCYEVRYGASWAAGTSIGTFNVSKVVRRVDWGGARLWWVAAVDVAGNYGTPASVNVNITAPGVVTGQRSEVIDNNVLIYWSPPTSGSLPIDRYEVRKGASWAAGTVVGSNGNSTFAAIFEQVSGVFTYWIAAYNSAGTAGTPLGITATVNQPPDYVLRSSIDSTLSGTATNLEPDADGSLVGPVNTTQTWSTHFSGNSWTSPADQVAAGKALYIEPSTATPATYVETFDLGAAVGSTTITATLNTVLLDGSVAVSCQIAYKTLSTDAWTNASVGTIVTASGFRYVQVTWTLTAAAGANMMRITGFNLKLSNKYKMDSGAGSAVSTDSGGTVVNFNVAFVQADCPDVQPVGTTATIAMVDYTSTPNPTSFKVLLFDRASGARVSGAFSWKVRGI